MKSRFACSHCGYTSSRWLGRCPDCGEWNTMAEEIIERHSSRAGNAPPGEILLISEVPLSGDQRSSTGMGELDRVLGGGLVPGSLVLIGGDPGIGKSTLLMQAAASMSLQEEKVLYVSGEESARQVRLRADRLNVSGGSLYLMAETDMDRIEAGIRKLKPSVVVVDSIQAVCKPGMQSTPGSVGQVRESAAQLLRLAKTEGIPMFLVGHVTKDGTLAGPRVLEHMVDAVLYFEGERHNVFRILRGVKNRFGSTNEIGIFRMENSGLKEVSNPSELFIAGGTRGNVAGSVVVPTMEGSRPLLVEIQALVSPTGFGNPRRMTAGVDYNRVSLILAVLEKRVGLHLGAQDAYVNAVGGVRLDEPAIDLGIALSLASSFKEIPLAGRMVALGEIGLTGEIRQVPQLEKRVAEAARLGFKACLAPGIQVQDSFSGDIRVIGVDYLDQAIEESLSI